MERGTPSLPPTPAEGVEVAKMGDEKTAAEGAAGAKDVNCAGGPEILHVSQYLRP